MILFPEAQFSIEIHLRDHVRFFRAERTRTLHRFIQQRLCQASAPMRRYGADGLHVGVIGLFAEPQTGKRGQLSVRADGRQT